MAAARTKTATILRVPPAQNPYAYAFSDPLSCKDTTGNLAGKVFGHRRH